MPMKPRISMIAAVGEKRELGRDNKLLWDIPEDMKRFKELTRGHVVVMGRKTYESIGRPLPQRVNIVVTRDPNSFLTRHRDVIPAKAGIQTPVSGSRIGVRDDKSAR